MCHNQGANPLPAPRHPSRWPGGRGLWRAGKRCSRWAHASHHFGLFPGQILPTAVFFKRCVRCTPLMRGSRRTPNKTMVPSWTVLVHVRMRIAGPTGDLGGPTKCERLLNFYCSWFLQEYLADLDFSRRSHGSRTKFNEHQVVPTFITTHCPRRSNSHGGGDAEAAQARASCLYSSIANLLRKLSFW
jgi:hypothetical protein